MEDAEWVQTHISCDDCGSSDALSINSNGWSKCFACGQSRKVDGDYEARGPKVSKDKSLIPFGEYKPLTARRISEETCKKFGYFIGEFKGTKVQVAPYHDEAGAYIGQKVRFANKDFLTRGEFKKVTLFGAHLWGTGGKKLVITEGEIDCMAVSQIQGNKWPVVSIPKGSEGAANDIKKALEYVMSFDEVILMFDNDDAGRKAVSEVAPLLPPGKCKVASLPLKDAGEMLASGRGQEVIQAIWNARVWRPDGIVDIEEILEDIEKPIEWGSPWCFPTLTKLTYGRRKGECYGIGAGTGIGKTDFMTQQIAFDVKELGVKCGVIYLEAKPIDTGKRIAGKIDGKRYHIPDGDHDREQLKATLQSLSGMVTFYDSWGETEWDQVKLKIRYMAVSKGIEHIYLDHLTAMADTSDERGSLEQIMKEMAGLANELNIIIHFVSHLATPDGKPHEEGGRVMIRHFKGSRAIGFWCHFMFGLERDQQAEDPEERQLTLFRILKDRYTGQSTGKTIELNYDNDTGMMYEANSVAPNPFKDETQGDSEAPPWDTSIDF